MKKNFKSLLALLLCVCELFTGCGISHLGNGTINQDSSTSATTEFDDITLSLRPVRTESPNIQMREYCLKCKEQAISKTP